MTSKKRILKWNRMVAVLLMLVMFVSISPVSAMETAEERESAVLAKIDPELLEAMETAGEDELLPIWIWRESIQDEEIYDLVREEKGYDPDLYEDEEAFEEEIKPEIEKQVEEIVGYERAHEELMPEELAAVIEEVVPEISEEISPELADELAAAVEGIETDGETLEFFNEEEQENENEAILGVYEADLDFLEDESFDEDIVKMAVSDFVVNEEMDTYVVAKNEVISQEYTKINDEFIDSYVELSEQEVLYSGGYTSTTIVMATKSDINDYAELKEVTGLTLYEEEIQESDMNISLDQVGVYSKGGTGYSQPGGGWMGFGGIGIKIGVLEAGCGKYDSNAPHLRNAKINFVQNIRANGVSVPYENTNHATLVTSIIAGKGVLFNGKLYEGVVPRATVYQMPVQYSIDVVTGIKQLADRGVQIINYSGGNSDASVEYTAHDCEVDKIVKNTGIVFVNSAGNKGQTSNGTGAVSSPGKAFNAITVGNASTKTGSATVAKSPYSMSLSSSYGEASYLPNKPDISAPGSYISCVIADNQLYSSSGTSFAAPIVTGIIAQMMEAGGSKLRNDPTLVKALLLLSADGSKISVTGNPSVGSYLNERSGAGFVNAIKAVTNSCEAAKISYKNYKPIGIPNTSYFSKGEKVRVVMTFNRNIESNIVGSAMLRDDIDLMIMGRGTGKTVAQSRSSYDNVEIVEYTFKESGLYYFYPDAFRVVDNNNRPNVAMAFSWS